MCKRERERERGETMQAFVNSSLYFFGSGREGDVIVTGERNAEVRKYCRVIFVIYCVL